MKTNTLILLFIFIIGYLLIMPYKEVLECNNVRCSVNRHYVYKTTTYNFKHTDKLISKRRGIIYNHSDNYLQRLFINPLFFENEYNLINHIKNNSECKITKYWIGYKIEK